AAWTWNGGPFRGRAGRRTCWGTAPTRRSAAVFRRRNRPTL
ncbi:MAG: hypothetical protein AVDCRST_MAG08-3975, partial [uncultured Acetobacteraceae bacterium]